MDNKSNGKLIALAIGGAVLMGALFFGVSFLTGYQVPAKNISSLTTPLSSFTGWFLLIFCASIIIMVLGKMSSRISDRWFLSFPLGALGLVALLFIILWVRPSGFLLPTTGCTTTLDGQYIRTVKDLTAFLAKPAGGGNIPKAPEGFDFDAIKSLTDARCNRCHTLDSVQDALRTKYKKTGQLDVVVIRMQKYPNSGITEAEANDIIVYLNEKF